jgi:hypothetical protein
VAHWDGASWVRDFAAGSSLNIDGTDGSARSVCLAFANDTPVVAWSEHSFGNGSFRKIYVKKYNTKVIGSEAEAGCRLNGGFAMRIFPNPFRSRVTFQFPAAQSRSVGRLAIYDLQGREVADLTPALSPGDPVKAEWKPVNMPAGIYFVRAGISGHEQVVKLMLAR